jgi:hypothetical protein
MKLDENEEEEKGPQHRVHGGVRALSLSTSSRPLIRLSLFLSLSNWITLSPVNALLRFSSTSDAQLSFDHPLQPRVILSRSQIPCLYLSIGSRTSSPLTLSPPCLLTVSLTCGRHSFLAVLGSGLRSAFSPYSLSLALWRPARIALRQSRLCADASDCTHCLLRALIKT